MHLGVEIFSCIFLLSTSLLTLSKHRGENVHNKPQQMKVNTYCRACKTKHYSLWKKFKSARPTNSNMQYSNCKLTIPFTTSTSNKLVNINVCTSMCTWSTSIKHLESRTMTWFWWMSLATSTRTTKPIDQLQITQSACIHFKYSPKIHRKKHKQSE